MSKTIVFGALILCANTFLRASSAFDKPVFVRDSKINIINSSTIPFKEHLCTISIDHSHIHINWTENYSYETCSIAIDPDRDVIQGRLKMTATDQAIFILGMQIGNRMKIDDYTTNHQYKYTVLRIDPNNCTYQSVSIPETNDDSRGDQNLPMIVEHGSDTDLFFSSLKNCAPCRFNDTGLRNQTLTAQITPEHSPSTDIYHEEHDVRFLKSMNAYFYVYHGSSWTTGGDITKLKLLDGDDFKTLKEKTIDFKVHAVSRRKDSIEHFGVCSKTYDAFWVDAAYYTNVTCHKLNANLDTTSTLIWTPTDSKYRSKPLSRISYEFDKEGNSYISFAEGTELRLYIVDKDSKLIKAFDVGGIDSKFLEYPPNSGYGLSEYNYWNVNGFVVGDEYCIVIKQSPSHYSTPLQEVVCIDVKEYVK